MWKKQYEAMCNELNEIKTGIAQLLENEQINRAAITALSESISDISKQVIGLNQRINDIESAVHFAEKAIYDSKDSLIEQIKSEEKKLKSDVSKCSTEIKKASEKNNGAIYQLESAVNMLMVQHLLDKAECEADNLLKSNSSKKTLPKIAEIQSSKSALICNMCGSPVPRSTKVCRSCGNKIQ